MRSLLFVLLVLTFLSASPADQHWSGCEGGYICDYMPGGGYQCIPNCGQRCYYV